VLNSVILYHLFAFSNTFIKLLLIKQSQDNTITKNNCTLNNWEGMTLDYSSNNNIIENNTCDSNKRYGIWLRYSSNYNNIYLNNFKNNANNVESSDSTNIWNSPSKITYTYKGKTCENYLGNYWSGYTGRDANKDGIGDTPYSINSDNDNYPLMERFENYFAVEKLQKGNIVVTTVYLHVRNITNWNNPLDPNNLIFTIPPDNVGKILDGPKTDNQYGYTWWNIEWDNCEIGWSAEGPFDKPTEKWLVKTDKPFIKIQDLEDPFNYQGNYELNQTELRAEEKKEGVLQNVTKYAKKYKISPALIMAIIRQESDFNANAKGDYWKGEYYSFGYMQVSYGAANDTYKEYTGDEDKGTEEEWKNDGLDPETNIKYGVRYLRIQHGRIKDGCSGYGDVYGDILKSTISAYNAGHPTLTNRMCYVLGGKCNGEYTGVTEGKSVNGEHRGYKFFLANRVPAAKPVITTPLEITAKDIYYVEDTLAAEFTITNRAAKSVTFDVLVVGGRGPTGEVVDFDKTYDLTLNPGDSYDYEGHLTLPNKPGIYHFFCAYHTEEHMPGEDEYNWNTNIDVEIDGKIVEDFSEANKYRERDIIVFEETYISPAPPPVLWEEIHGPWDSWPTSLGNWNEAPQIDVNPNNPNEIYLEAIHRTNNWWEDQGGKLYKSTNGGDSWNPINPGLPRLTLSEYYWPIRAIAIAPSNPDIIYVGTSGLNPYSSLLPSAKGIYKSTNGGSEWTSVGGPYTGKWIFKTYCSISSLVVDPTDPDTVYAGTVGGGIWKTTNGGESWEKIWDTPVPDKSLDVNALAISPANPNTIYAATYHFPPENLYASGLAWEYDLIKSENGGDTFETVPHPEKGEFIQYKIDDIAVDNKNADIVYVIDERYKVYRSTTGGKNWLEASGVGGNDPLPFIQSVPGLAWFHRYGKSGSIAIPTAYSNVIYASGEWGFKNVYHSHDSGENWLPYGDLKDRHVKELVLASNTDSCVIYATAIEGLFKVDISNSMPSDDNYRLTWVYETDASPNCVSVASDGGYIAVGSPDGLYLLDRDKNLIWAYQTDFPIVDV
jgi:parallel beta-helix repeat protein